MIRINSSFGKSVSVVTTFALFSFMMPGMAWAKTIQDSNRWVKSILPPVTADPLPSKILSAETMLSVQGRSGENPYSAGQSKWDVMYKCVDVMTGNYLVSGTDLCFEGGYGIPVNVTRSYSANDGEEGPLGKGWTLSVDVRSTAGGMMKSSGSAVHSIPTNFKERPSSQVDPNAEYGNGASGNTSSTSPVQAVLATDSSGTEETIQRDADGILSTPPWDKNKIDSTYETVIDSSGNNYQIMTHNVVNTPEGTVYVYDKQGAYVGAGGSPFALTPYNNPSATAEPSNVLKITTATDRQGNVTTYTYGSGTVSFVKSNGTTSEHPLTSIQMPNGHQINFVWGTGAAANRIVEANDGSGPGSRHVYYGYTSGLLTSFTSPGGKTVSYGYGDAVENYSYGPSAATSLMTSITDPRGLQTSISYTMEFVPRYGWTPAVHRQVAPNGVKTDYMYYPYGSSSGYPVSDVFDYTGADYDDSAGGPANLIHGFEITQNISGNTFSVIARQTLSPYVVFTGGSDLWQKDYDIPSQNLMTETDRVFDHSNQPSRFANSYSPTPDGPSMTNYSVSSFTYNFIGNPLTKSGAEYSRSGTSMVLDRSTSTAYAYWGAEKYYQQKAVQDSGGRLTYTDYYDNNSAAGRKGQTYRVYDQARAYIYLDTGASIPSYSTGNTAAYWRYQVTVGDLSKYSCQYDYDSKGRAIDVWKIQNATTTPWTYVRTHTLYGSDSSPAWGAASEVIEDYGGINRTTQNLDYDTCGRVVKVQNPAGTVFHTTYDPDGIIQSVEKVVGSSSTPIVTYTYGSSGLNNGALLTVTDNLSGAVDTLTYVSSGGGKGDLASFSETMGSDSYSTTYTYSASGDRSTATHVTESALGLGSTTEWKYSDFLDIGAETSKRVFQTLSAVDSSTGNLLPEEFHYAFDSSGRPRQVTFAMTPQSWTPSGGATYYDGSHKAATRGRAFYNYDGGGRISGIYNWWDTLQSNNSYASAPIRANESSYETTGLMRGLKTQSKYYNVSSGSWNLQRTEGYGYDSNLDYLTSASYGDGLSGASPSWTYDDAGNRVTDSTISGTWSYDNLNRLTASPGVTGGYANDILGNRTAKGSGSTATTYSWDDLNRMTSLVAAGTTSNYSYRDDGMRILKESHAGATASNLTQYRYEGQMGLEDVESYSSNGGVSYSITAINRYALGARGIDAISRTTSSGTSVSYPLYDTHGNNVGLLSKSGSTWAISDERSYDAWGQVRSGASTGDNKSRYCANIGHKQDDESGLIYMRARYYEKESGRFISEDHGRHGQNWFSYASNNPVNRIDRTGNMDGEIPSLSLLEVFEAVICVDFVKHCIKLGSWGYNNPNECNIGRQFVALVMDLGVCVVAGLMTAALLAAAATVIGVAGLGVVAAVICLAMVILIAYLADMAMDNIDNWDMGKSESGGGGEKKSGGE